MSNSEPKGDIVRHFDSRERLGLGSREERRKRDEAAPMRRELADALARQEAASKGSA